MQQQRISTLASNLITSIRKKARLKFLSVLVAGSALVLPLTAFSQNLGSDGITCNEPDLAAALATVGAGGTVYVPNGTQNIDVWGTTVVPEDVTLQGTDSTCTAGSVGTGTLEYTAAGRILEVDPDVHLILIDVVLLGGDSTGNGGTVWLDDDATLAMFDSVLESGVSGGNGGCLAIEGGSLSMFGDSVAAALVRLSAGVSAVLH